MHCSIIKAQIVDEYKDGKKIPIRPNRVVFREDITRSVHTLFAPGSDRENALGKMGIITITRISRDIFGVFDLTQKLDPQLRFFTDVRFFPRIINVLLTRADQISENKRNDLISTYSTQIKAFFEERGIQVRQSLPMTTSIKSVERREKGNSTFYES